MHGRAGGIDGGDGELGGGDGGLWWSDINPLAMTLARETVLGTSDGREAWRQLCGLLLGKKGEEGAAPFDVHLWVADRKLTVCSWEGDGSIADMQREMPAAAVREWPGAGHSIHNTDREQYVAALKKIIDDAAAAAASASAEK